MAKMVNGVEVPLTAQEEAEFAAQAAAWAAGASAREKALRLVELRKAAVEAFLDEQMALRAAQPGAPKEVRDWNTEKNR